MDIAVSGEEQIAISRDAKHCIWKHAEAIGHGKDGEWVSWRIKGFVVIYLFLSKNGAGTISM